jgi:hypothetical protein
MIGKTSTWAVRVFSVLLVGCCSGVLAQAQMPVHYSGLINDYTGPWQISGAWALDLHGQSGTANFSAALNMEASAADPRIAHTHNVALTNATVTFDANDCPTSQSDSATPLTTTAFKIYGTVSLMTANGQRAPFEQKPPLPPISTLTVCVTGGLDNPYANVTLQFGTPASKHFGTQAIHGVVLQTN